MSTQPEPATLDGRFWAKASGVGSPDECWVWTGATMEGYGQFFHDGASRLAHRLSYADKHGSIPAGLILDHLCRNRPCVNPAHLEPVTNRENILRGVGASAQHARATTCSRGHAYTPENTYLRGNRRDCIRCQKARRRQRTTCPTCSLDIAAVSLGRHREALHP